MSKRNKDNELRNTKEWEKQKKSVIRVREGQIKQVLLLVVRGISKILISKACIYKPQC